VPVTACPGDDLACSAQLRSELAALRDRHLDAVDRLLEAIDEGRVEEYLATQFTCP
jgi:hypothetical protein